MTRSIDDVLGSISPTETTVQVCFQGNLVGEHEELQAQLTETLRADATSNRAPQAPKLARRIEKLEKLIEDQSTTFRLVAISRKAWTDLENAHPPTKAHAAQGLAWNPDVFPHAVLAACVVEPTGMTAAKSAELADKVSFGQWHKVWKACLAVNLEGTETPFSATAFVLLHGSETKPVPPGNNESPDQSS